MKGQKQFLKKENLKLFKTLSIAWGAIITVLCLMPSPDLPKAGNIPHLDKIVHFTFYFVWAIISLITAASNGLIKKAHIPRILGALFIYSLLIEIMQWGLPFGRSFSVFDLIFNASGLIIGWWTYQSVVAKKLI